MYIGQSRLNVILCLALRAMPVAILILTNAFMILKAKITAANRTKRGAFFSLFHDCTPFLK